MSSSSPKVVVFRDPAVIDLLAEDYQSLIGRAYWINPYFSPSWLRAWWSRQKQERNPLVLVAYSENRELLGFWPFVERPGLLGAKGLWPFIFDEANYHYPTCTQEAASSLINSLRELIGTFLFVWVPQVPASFWENHLCHLVRESSNLSIIRNHKSSCLVEPFDEISFEDFWRRKTGKKSRKSLEYDVRALLGQGKLSFEVSTSFKDVRAAMPATCMIEVQSRKALENAGLYTIRGKRAFFFDLLPELGKSGSVRVTILRVDDHPIAWQLELLEPRKSYIHHLAYDEEWKKYSPGKQLLRFCMQCCWKENRTIDFLPAFFAYKEKYATRSIKVYELHWIARSLRGRIARRLILWNMKIRENLRKRGPGLASSVAREEVRRIQGKEEQ